MPRFIHFDLPADDVERAKNFYGKIFGWKFDKWDGPMEYWMTITGDEKTPGINGGLCQRMPGQTAIINTIDVPSVDEYSTKIQSGGGRILAPKMPIPGVGYFAQCMDTEGNVFGIIQMDKNVK
jgi:uncharacterized protein